MKSPLRHDCDPFSFSSQEILGARDKNGTFFALIFGPAIGSRNLDDIKWMSSEASRGLLGFSHQYLLISENFFPCFFMEILGIK